MGIGSHLPGHGLDVGFVVGLPFGDIRAVVLVLLNVVRPPWTLVTMRIDDRLVLCLRELDRRFPCAMPFAYGGSPFFSLA